MLRQGLDDALFTITGPRLLPSDYCAEAVPQLPTMLNMGRRTHEHSLEAMARYYYGI